MTRAPSDQSPKIYQIELAFVTSSTYHLVVISFLSDIVGSALKIGTFHVVRLTSHVKVFAPLIVSIPVLCTRLLVLSVLPISSFISCMISSVNLISKKSPASKFRGTCETVLGSAVSSWTQDSNALVIVNISPTLFVIFTISLFVTIPSVFQCSKVATQFVVAKRSPSPVFTLIVVVAASIPVASVVLALFFRL